MIFQQSPVADFCDQRFHPPAARFKGDSDVLQEQSLCRTLLCAACDGWTKDPGHTHNPIAICVPGLAGCCLATLVPRRIKLAKTLDTCPQHNTEAALARFTSMPT
jgi:hypothetical protein